MARRRTVVVQQGSTNVRIEYVKSRGNLRLVVSHEPGTDLEPIEVPLQELIDHLPIEPSDIAQTWYLLFAARSDEGRRHDLVRTFRSQVEARAAFIEWRESAAFAAGGWAEVVALDPNGHVKQVCWDGARGLASAHTGEDADDPGERRTAGRWRRRPPGSSEGLG